MDRDTQLNNFIRIIKRHRKSQEKSNKNMMRISNKKDNQIKYGNSCDLNRVEKIIDKIYTGSGRRIADLKDKDDEMNTIRIEMKSISQRKVQSLSKRKRSNAHKNQIESAQNQKSLNQCKIFKDRINEPNMMNKQDESNGKKNTKHFKNVRSLQDRINQVLGNRNNKVTTTSVQTSPVGHNKNIIQSIQSPYQTIQEAKTRHTKSKTYEFLSNDIEHEPAKLFHPYSMPQSPSIRNKSSFIAKNTRQKCRLPKVMKNKIKINIKYNENKSSIQTQISQPNKKIYDVDISNKLTKLLKEQTKIRYNYFNGCSSDRNNMYMVVNGQNSKCYQMDSSQYKLKTLRYVDLNATVINKYKKGKTQENPEENERKQEEEYIQKSRINIELVDETKYGVNSEKEKIQDYQQDSNEYISQLKKQQTRKNYYKTKIKYKLKTQQTKNIKTSVYRQLNKLIDGNREDSRGSLRKSINLLRQLDKSKLSRMQQRSFNQDEWKKIKIEGWQVQNTTIHQSEINNGFNI